MLTLSHLSRSFHSGNTHALTDVSLSCERGSILGVVGVNGAGKTTLIKICAGLLAPTSGDITLDGISLTAPGYSQPAIGLVLGGEGGFYPRASVRDNMRFFADLAGIPWREQKTEIARVLECTDLTNLSPRKFGELSRGQRQRLHIARALLGSPPLLLLDEPTIGLDPDAAYLIHQLIASLATPERVIVLTSHSMSEISALSTEIAVLNAGKLLIQGTTSDVLARAGVSHVLDATFFPGSVLDTHTLKGTLTPYGLVMLRPHSTQWNIQVICSSHARAQQARQHLSAVIPEASESHSVIREATLDDAFLSFAQVTRGRA